MVNNIFIYIEHNKLNVPYKYSNSCETPLSPEIWCHI